MNVNYMIGYMLSYMIFSLFMLNYYVLMYGLNMIFLFLLLGFNM